MTDYTVGFVFDENIDHVALVRKLRPSWQNGLLNGVGGKIEEGETPLQTMVRECEEEFGVHIEHWNQLITLHYPHGPYTITVFRTVVSNDLFNNIRQTTDEPVEFIDIGRRGEYKMVNNLHWLIDMAVWEGPHSNTLVLPPCDHHLEPWIKTYDANLQTDDSGPS